MHGARQYMCVADVLPSVASQVPELGGSDDSYLDFCRNDDGGGSGSGADTDNQDDDNNDDDDDNNNHDPDNNDSD